MIKHAKNIVTQDINGNPFDLSTLAGKKILLTFYRDAYCPFCNLRIKEITKLQDEFGKYNAMMVGIFNSTATEIIKHNKKRNFNLWMIADPENKLYKEYNISRSYTGMLKAFLRIKRMIQFTMAGYFTLKSLTKSPLLPVDFLIDENQNIVKSYYGKDFGDHMPINEILNFIKQ